MTITSNLFVKKKNEKHKNHMKPPEITNKELIIIKKTWKNILAY